MCVHACACHCTTGCRVCQLYFSDLQLKNILTVMLFCMLHRAEYHHNISCIYLLAEVSSGGGTAT